MSLDGELKVMHQSDRWPSAEINVFSSERRIKFSKKEISTIHVVVHIKKDGTLFILFGGDSTENLPS